MIKRGDWRWLRAVVVGVSLLVLLLTWGFSLHQLAATKEQVLESAHKQQNNLAVIIVENLKQLLDSTRTFAFTATEWWDGSPQEVSYRLSAMSDANPAVLRVALYDKQGRRVYSSSPLSDDSFLSDAVSEILQARLQHHVKESAFVPLIPTSPENAWYKPVFFPVGDPDTDQSGLLMVMFDLGHLLRVYQHIDFGASGVIHVLSRDAQEIVEWRPEGLVLNSQKKHFDFFLDQSEKRLVNTLVVDLFKDGQDYLSSFKHVGDFPFLLVVSRSIEDILQPYRKFRFNSLLTLIALTIIIIMGLYFVISHIAQHGTLFSSLVLSDEKNRSLITRLESEKDRAFVLASQDHLTGLPNRRTFNELVVRYLTDARQHYGYAALLYLDLDRFKSINDTLGHDVGDRILKIVAMRLQAALRQTDIVARLGGDEFAIFLTGVANIEAVSVICNKLISQVSQPVATAGEQEIHISPSIGIAVLPRDGNDFETLCKNADVAMYESKRKGRSTYTYYSAALSSSSERRFKLEQGFPSAIINNELVLHYQPKVRLSDFKIIGFEALVRWEHPKLGLIYPNDFIPLAEEIGGIAELGEWVANASCLQQALWQAEGLDCVPIAINLSPIQLQSHDLPDRIQRILTEHSVAANLLEVEVTETMLLDKVNTAIQVLSRLEALGVRIALDDFGSGFSNFSYIKALPIQTIKIDQQFIRDIKNSTQDAVLVASIISLAKNLGMDVVAEGVETLEQLIYLKTAGCNQAQGYYFSRPISAAMARDLLNKGVLTPSAGII